MTRFHKTLSFWLVLGEKISHMFVGVSSQASDLCQILRWVFMSFSEREKIIIINKMSQVWHVLSGSGANVLRLFLYAAFVSERKLFEMTHRARVMKIVIIHIDCIIYFWRLRLSSAKSHFRIIKKKIFTQEPFFWSFLHLRLL